MNTDKAKITGVKLGLAYLIFFIPFTIIEIFELSRSSFALHVFMTLVAIILNVFYLYFLLGLLAVAAENPHVKEFQKNVKGIFILVNVALGVFRIKLSKNFSLLIGQYGSCAKKAAVWNRIIGWLLVSVVLSPQGILINVIPDFYDWKILRKAK